MTIKTLIFDDEQSGRKNIRHALQYFPNWKIEAEFERGDIPLTNLKKYSADVIFLDIKMPGNTGIKLAKDLTKSKIDIPHIIFVTAYNEHAIDAFDLCAVDYLLKPFNKKRFEQTIFRAEKIIKTNQHIPQLEQWSSLENKSKWLTKVLVRSIGSIQIVPADKIIWIKGAGNYVELFTNNKTYLHRAKLSFLETHLDPNNFIRVHRSAIVSVSQIKEISILSPGQHCLILHNDQTVNIGKQYEEELFKRLGI